MREALGKNLSSIIVPEIGERYELSAGLPARRLRTGRVDLQESLSSDWQNAYADLATRLKSDLHRIRDERRRQEAIARIREVLDSYADFRNGRQKRADGARG